MARTIKTSNGNCLSYAEWSLFNENSAPRFDLLPLGVGGVLYPPESLSPEVFNLNNLKEMALTTDDLWLKVMSRLIDTKVASVSGKFCLQPINITPGRRIDTHLYTLNIGKGQNDKNFAALVKRYQLSADSFKEL